MTLILFAKKQEAMPIVINELPNKMETLQLDRLIAILASGPEKINKKVTAQSFSDLSIRPSVCQNEFQIKTALPHHFFLFKHEIEFFIFYFLYLFGFFKSVLGYTTKSLLNIACLKE
jgi:hypothetical protein